MYRILIILLLLANSAIADSYTNFYHNDLFGSPVLITDEAGRVVSRESYTPYGKSMGKISDGNQPVDPNAHQPGYTGHTFDSELGLVYMGARYYDPMVGRFMSIDNAGVLDHVGSNSQMFNRYTYANNNPYKYNDPDGNLPFLVPVGIFIAKEVAAEIASRATNGASDFLSMRRVGTMIAKKGMKAAKNLISTGCSFDGSTEVMAQEGYKRIYQIEPGIDRVLAKSEISGRLGWKTVNQRFSARYEELLTVAIRDLSSTDRQEIISNRTHPYFIVRYSDRDSGFIRTNNSKSYFPPANIPGGQWVNADKLMQGDRLLNADGTWSVVETVRVELQPLLAYNLDVAEYNTFFVRAGDSSSKGVWVHNAKVCNPSSVRKSSIGLSEDAARSALSNVGRVDHASRHLIDAGIIAGNPGSKEARKAFQDLGQNILTSPTKTFDHVMSRGGHHVKGFMGQSNGQDVIIFVAKEARGKIRAGDIVTAIKPSSQQISNFGK